MRKHLIALMLCLAILLAAFPATALAGGGFTDTADHWAAKYIQDVCSLGLFSGTSDTTFSPNAGMTRGMFVTVLGRLAGVKAAQWKENQPFFTDVRSNAYYAPYISWAVHNGVAKGTGNFTFSPDSPVTREQMSVLVANYSRFLGYSFKPPEQTPYTGDFTDEKTIAKWASDAVDLLQITGILSGIANGDGTYRFAPKSGATRAECCVVFSKLHRALVKNDKFLLPSSVKITAAPASLSRGQSFLLKADIAPEIADNQAMTWVSNNPAVVRVTTDGLATWQSPGTAVLSVVTCNQKKASVTVTAQSAADLAYKGETYSSKCNRIFGRYVDDPRLVYSSSAEAERNLTTITVNVWDIGSNKQKITRTYNLTIHKNIAATVQQIFAEIYALPSKPPIHSLGGYRWCSKSEHTPGLAIDINWDENYYCDPNGNAITGSFFEPSRSEYSFPVGGEVEKIFEKYGFTRGIYWRSGYKDYMHFSFFGT